MSRIHGLDPNGRLRGARMQADHVPDPERWHGLISQIEELSRAGETGAVALVSLMLEYHRPHAAHEEHVRTTIRRWAEHGIRPRESLAPRDSYYELVLLCRDALVAIGPAAIGPLQRGLQEADGEPGKPETILRHTLEMVQKAK